MDSSEQIAERYLRALAIGEVVHEPDGNIPPDFVVDGRIAVEVRRLNQNHEGENGPVGLEGDRAALVKMFEKALPKFGPSDGGKSWWVFFYFWRPLDMKALKVDVHRALESFKQNPIGEGVRLLASQGLELEIDPAGIPLPNFFSLGGLADRDLGGWVGSEIVRNLQICIPEKAAKVAPYRHRYPEWWLVMPDMIGPQLNVHERSQIPGSVDLHGWDKVVLIDPGEISPPLEL